MVAFQNFDVTLGTRIFILENSKLASFWNIFIDFDCAEIEVFTKLYKDLSTVWNFIPDLFVSYIMFADFLLEVLLIHEAKFPLVH